MKVTHLQVISRSSSPLLRTIAGAMADEPFGNFLGNTSSETSPGMTTDDTTTSGSYTVAMPQHKSPRTGDHVPASAYAAPARASGSMTVHRSRADDLTIQSASGTDTPSASSSGRAEAVRELQIARAREEVSRATLARLEAEERVASCAASVASAGSRRSATSVHLAVKSPPAQTASSA